MKTVKEFLNETRKKEDKTSETYNKIRITKKERDANAPVGYYWSSLWGRYVPKTNKTNESTLDEASKNYSKETPYGLRHLEFGGKGGRLRNVETWHKSSKARENFANKLKDKDGFMEIQSHYDPGDTHESVELDEAYMNDIVNHKEGDIVHPFRSHGGFYGGLTHRNPHIIDKKLASKTILKDVNTGKKYSVSHATGKVKDEEGIEQKYSFHGFHNEDEKNEIDTQKNKQHEKDAAHDAIIKHLAEIKNSRGNAIGSLTPETHAAILAHLEKLKE